MNTVWEKRRKRLFEIIEIGSNYDAVCWGYDFFNTFTILLNLTVSIMYTFDNMELKYGPLVLMLSSSLCMYSLENRAQPEVFTNAFSGIWWAASTLLTVGYDDIYPVTTIGKIFGIFIAFLGVGMVAIPTGIISAGFVDQYSRLKRIGEYGQEEDVHFIRIRLTENDQWVNHRIMELNMPERIIIAVIQRNHRILVPKGDTVVLYTQTYMANADDLKI